MGAIMSDIGLATSLPTPVADASTAVDDTTIVVSPTIANDDDLIEKEWVEKAKKIVAETQNNPYQREKQVSKLQSDYIKKRYGREIGVAE
jgi:Txe/YoeB family toxin of Txe-Axe toxin-antitoxin module